METIVWGSSVITSTALDYQSVLRVEGTDFLYGSEHALITDIMNDPRSWGVEGTIAKIERRELGEKYGPDLRISYYHEACGDCEQECECGDWTIDINWTTEELISERRR